MCLRPMARQKSFAESDEGQDFTKENDIMKYAIGGLTKNHEYEQAVPIIARHQGIDPFEFRRGIHNVFPDEATALTVVHELSSAKELTDCCWHCYPTDQD